MSSATIERNVLYLTLRMLVWSGASAGQAFMHSQYASSTTRQPLTLGYMIAAVTGLSGVRDVWLLIWVTSKSIPALYVEALLDSAALAAFLGVLLLISGGYCITVFQMRELPRYIVALPATMLVTDTVMQWLSFALQTAGALQDPTTTLEQDEAILLVVSAFIQTALLVVSVVYIMENTEAVARQLEALAPGALAASGGEGDLPEADGLHGAMPDGAHLPQGSPHAAAGYGAVQYQITTVGEEVERLKAARLLRRFKFAVSAYLCLSVVVLFLPAFFTASDSAVNNFCLVGWNASKLACLLLLGWAFRPKEDQNMYLQLGAQEGDGPQLETHIEMGGVPSGAPATQWAHDPPANGASALPRHGSQSLQSPVAAPARQKSAKNAAALSPRKSGGMLEATPSAKFTLDEDEKID